MEYLGADGPVVNSPNIDKGITALTININLNFYIEDIKHRTLQTFHTFSHITNITNWTKKTADRVSSVKEKKKLLRYFLESKKGNC